MSALDVLPLDKAKEYLNIPDAVTTDDAELLEFIPAAVERVDRHLFGIDAGRSLVDAAQVTASELLACKTVLAEYWLTQRVWLGQGAGIAGGGVSAAAIEADSGPSGAAPLEVRLTELLGPAAALPGSGLPEGLAPRGCFPEPQCWPDQAGVFGQYGYWR